MRASTSALKWLVGSVAVSRGLFGCGGGDSPHPATTIYPATPGAGVVVVTGVVSQCPQIQPLTVEPTEVSLGNVISLSIDARDPDNLPRPIAYTWLASNGWRAAGKQAEFPCEKVGTYKVKAIVSDGLAGCGQPLETETVELRCSAGFER